MVSFNPRAHEGRDEQLHELRAAARVSIHAPTRGATRTRQLTFFDLYVSIHAPTRGATLRAAQGRVLGVGFNPRAHEGRDRPVLCNRYRQICFNPRAHEGRDGGGGNENGIDKGFNPRAHEGRDL